MSRDTEPVVLTVTFLCTDIVGSTRLWQENGALMRERLAWHDATVLALAKTYGGDPFKARGDGYFLAFPTALTARDMATTLQRALHTEFGDTFQIRTVLATGEAQHRDGDYYCLALSRASRVLELSHGQQIVLTEATARLIQEAEPRSTPLLKDLGPHPLRSLELPERLFQYTVPELPTDFPELTHGMLPPHNLPRTLTTFIGRERECAEVERLLAKTRLLTVLGAGGSGKTRLSLRVGDELLLEYPGGVWFVDLAPVADEALLPRAVGAALRIREETGGDLVGTILTHLTSRKVLLILDNCEHLVAAVAQFVEQVLSQCPDVTIFATSREALELYGEIAWSLPGLALPPEKVVQPARLLRYEAVVLFVERASASSPKFRLTATNGACVARICRRLDGVPLALELAAAWMSVLSPEQIEQRLEARFKFLTRGSRTALPRQQTLKGALDWSYELLTNDEQVLWRRLSVFAGGFTLETVESVCADEMLPTDAVLEAIFGLVRKSILLRDSSSEERYRILETIREYGLERLMEADELTTFRLRHLQHFTALAEEAEPHLRGPDQKAWLDRLEVEHPNLRAALREPGDGELALHLAAAIFWFWLVRGYLPEGLHFLTNLLQGCEQQDTKLLAQAHRAAGILAMQLHHREEAEQHFLIAQKMYLQNGLESEAATITANLGINASHQNRLEIAEAYLNSAMEHYRRVNDEPRLCQTLINTGVVHFRKSNYELSINHFNESLSLSSKLNDSNSSAISLINLSTNYLYLQEHATALDYSIRSIQSIIEIQNESLLPRAIWLFTEILINLNCSKSDISSLLGFISASLARGNEPLDSEQQQTYTTTHKDAQSELPQFGVLFETGASFNLEELYQYCYSLSQKCRQISQ